MNKLCIFVHFDKDNFVDDYVFYYLRCLKKVSSWIIFVTTSKIGENDVFELREICNSVITRENIGYDFMSWKVGLSSVEEFDDYDEIIICNDSVYGPLYPLEKIFEEMDKRKCDFWGMTCNHEQYFHIQSYFVVFRKRLLTSLIFKIFWDSIKLESNKWDIIEKYEIGMSKKFSDAGFKMSVYANTKPFCSDIITKPVLKSRFLGMIDKIKFRTGREGCGKGLNPTHFYWRKLITEQKMPFLKVELLRDNPMGIDISNYENIIKNTNYDLKLLNTHLMRIKG